MYEEMLESVSPVVGTCAPQPWPILHAPAAGVPLNETMNVACNYCISNATHTENLLK